MRATRGNIENPVISPDPNRMTSEQRPLAPAMRIPTAIRIPPNNSFMQSSPPCAIAGKHARPFGACPVECIVCVERDDLALRRHEVDAAPLHRAEIEIVAVEELQDHDAEAVRVAQFLRHHRVRQAAQKPGQFLLGVGLRGRQRQEVENLRLQFRIGFVADGVRPAEDQLLRKQACQRSHVPALPKRIADRDLVRVARERNHVLGLEHARLADLAPNLRQQHAIFVGVEMLVAARVLHRLKVTPRTQVHSSA